MAFCLTSVGRLVAHRVPAKRSLGQTTLGRLRVRVPCAALADRVQLFRQVDSGPRVCAARAVGDRPVGAAWSAVLALEDSHDTHGEVVGRSASGWRSATPTQSRLVEWAGVPGRRETWSPPPEPAAKRWSPPLRLTRADRSQIGLDRANRPACYQAHHRSQVCGPR